MKSKQARIRSIGALLLAVSGFQLFYWFFANSVEPVVLGLPFGMFFVTALIVLEFLVLLALYFVDRLR